MLFSRVNSIDARGATLTAGFWNSHVHLLSGPLLNAEHQADGDLSEELLQMLNRWGFTAVFDTGSALANTNVIRRRIGNGDVTGPMILTVGDPFYPHGGTPVYVRQFLADHGFPDEEIRNLPDAVARAHQQLEAGADGVKLFTGAIVGGDVGVLPMPAEQAKALSIVAHESGKPVFAHPSNLAGLRVAIDSGADILAHTTPMTGPWSSALIREIRDHHMALVPTLTLFEVEARKFGDSDDDARREIDNALQQVREFARANGQVLFGTDVGYTDVYDTSEEFRLLSRALNWRGILAALTTAPAQRFGFASRKGRVEAGMDADLVLLDGDPASDGTAFAKILMTLRAGRTTFESIRLQR